MSFSLKEAIYEYQAIESEFSNSIISEGAARNRLDLLNKKCADNQILFSAPFSSLVAASDNSFDDDYEDSYEDSYEDYDDSYEYNEE